MKTFSIFKKEYEIVLIMLNYLLPWYPGDKNEPKTPLVSRFHAYTFAKEIKTLLLLDR